MNVRSNSAARLIIAAFGEGGGGAEMREEESMSEEKNEAHDEKRYSEKWSSCGRKLLLGKEWSRSLALDANFFLAKEKTMRGMTEFEEHYCK
jgi:hypothetical protein